MSLEKLGADKKKLREGFPGFRLEAGSPGQKDELLARKEAFHCASWPFQLLLSDLGPRTGRKSNPSVTILHVGQKTRYRIGLLRSFLHPEGEVLKIFKGAIGKIRP